MTSDISDPNRGKYIGSGGLVSLTMGIVDRYRIIDLIFVCFIIVMTIYYSTIISIFSVPIGDGSVYMINAREWLNNEILTEVYRPPLFSWIMDAIWIFTGENSTIIKYVQAAFTIASIVLLYLILRRKKGALFAFGVSSLTLTNAQLFFYTSQMLTEGISLFFLILTLYLLEGRNKIHWLISGISMGLTFSARYPILLQAMIIFGMESVLKKDVKGSVKTIIILVFFILIVAGIVIVKTGTFEVSLEKDSNFGNSFSLYYIENSISIWSPAIILLPIAFLFKSTYADKFNFVFISWFLISLIFWSTNSSNYQNRFMIQFMPSAYFLVILAVENLVKFKRANIILLRSSKG